MKWGRDIDYHGSRSYGDDQTKARWLKRVIAWMANGGRRKSVETGPGAKSSEVLLRDRHLGALLIGNGNRAPLRRPVDCPFPIKSNVHVDRNDWRLLP